MRRTYALRTARIAAMVVGGLLLQSSAASAQQGWTAIRNVSTTPYIGAPRLAVEADGDAMAAWVDNTSGNEVIRVSHYARATDAWSATTIVDSAPSSTGDPIVALDINDTGQGVVAWTQGSLTGFVRVALFNPETVTWSSPTEISMAGHHPTVAIDETGNVVAVWQEWNGAYFTIKAVHYTASTGAWSGSASLSEESQQATSPAIVMDSAGNTAVVWARSNGTHNIIQSVRRSAIDGLWTPAADLSLAGYSATHPVLAVDGLDNVIAAWSRFDGSNDIIQASRYVTTASAWSAPVDVSAGEQNALHPRLAADAEGNAVAIWSAQSTDTNWGLQSAAYSSGGAWRSAGTLSASASAPIISEIAVDAAGNATAVWSAPGQLVLAARRPTDGLWTMSTLAGRSFDPQVAFDAAGHATAIWRRVNLTTNFTAQSARWLATPVAPTITEVTPGNRELAVFFTAPATEPGFANTNYDYSLDDGVTWTTRSPAAAASPLIVGGLANGTTYTVRLRGVNSAGSGVASSPASGTPAPIPLAPSHLAVASIVGNTVTVGWAGHIAGIVPSGYVLEGGLLPGEVLASIPVSGSLTTTLTFTAPTGIFYIRVHAVAGAAKSAPSNEIRIFVNVQVPPSAPAGLLGLADGSSLTLAWRNTAGGGAPTGIILDVAGAITMSLTLPVSESFSFFGVPAGVYSFVVRAFNGAGHSMASNPVTLSFPGTCLPPSMPADFLASLNGRVISVSWAPPPSGAAPTGYTVIVSGSFVGSFATTTRALSGTAGPGTYQLSVIATNPCGSSAATPTRTITVP